MLFFCPSVRLACSSWMSASAGLAGWSARRARAAAGRPAVAATAAPVTTRMKRRRSSVGGAATGSVHSGQRGSFGSFIGTSGLRRGQPGHTLRPDIVGSGEWEGITEGAVGDVGAPPLSPNLSLPHHRGVCEVILPTERYRNVADSPTFPWIGPPPVDLAP